MTSHESFHAAISSSIVFEPQTESEKARNSMIAATIKNLLRRKRLPQSFSNEQLLGKLISLQMIKERDDQQLPVDDAQALSFPLFCFYLNAASSRARDPNGDVYHVDEAFFFNTEYQAMRRMIVKKDMVPWYREHAYLFPLFTVSIPQGVLDIPRFSHLEEKNYLQVETWLTAIKSKKCFQRAIPAKYAKKASQLFG